MIMSVCVDVTEVKVQDLLEEFAHDYSKYFRTDISDQISKLEVFIEESVAKLEELTSLFEMKQNETKEWYQNTLPHVLHQGQKLYKTLNERIEALQNLIKIFKTTLDQLELQITDAENELGISSSLRSVFKYFRKNENPFPLPRNSQLEIKEALEVDEYFHEKVVITPT